MAGEAYVTVSRSRSSCPQLLFKACFRLQEIQELQSKLDQHHSENRLLEEDSKRLRAEVERKNEYLYQKDAEIERLSNALETNLASAVLGQNSAEMLKVKEEELKEIQEVVSTLKQHLLTQQEKLTQSEARQDQLRKDTAETASRQEEECRKLDRQLQDAETATKRALEEVKDKSEQLSASTRQLIEVEHAHGRMSAEVKHWKEQCANKDGDKDKVRVRSIALSVR